MLSRDRSSLNLRRFTLGCVDCGTRFRKRRYKPQAKRLRFQRRAIQRREGAGKIENDAYTYSDWNVHVITCLFLLLENEDTLC